MKDTIRHVGLDVHKDSIAIAVAEEGGGEPAILATIPNELNILLKHLIYYLREFSPAAKILGG